MKGDVTKEVTTFEHLTTKVPYEVLNKKFRLAQKNIDRECSTTQSLATELMDKLEASSKNPSEPVKFKDIDGLVGKLDSALDRFAGKLASAVSHEADSAQLLKKRLEHLDGAVDGDGAQWKKTRMDRMIVDYLLRSGYLSTAMKMVDRLDLSRLTNHHLFESAFEVESALRRKDLAPCLRWCADNKSKMRRMKSMFELHVRRQEFVELIRAGSYVDATKYAQRHFSGLGTEAWKHLLPYMGLLAHLPDTTLVPYQYLYSEDRWGDVLDEFHEENLRLFQLNVQSVFSSCLQVGLSALKTPHCSTINEFPTPTHMHTESNAGSTPFASRSMEDMMDTTTDSSSIDEDLAVDFSIDKREPPPHTPTMSICNRRAECPICVPQAGHLASEVPFAHMSQSRLVCYLSGETMNEHNPPMALPNGMVYSRRTLLTLSADHPDGLIVCPRTKSSFCLDDAQRVFVM